MAALIVRDGPSAGHRIEVAAEVVLGREDSAFLQHDPEVSRNHAAVRPSGDALEVEDLGSSNGTFVNEERVTGVRALRGGDVVRVGSTAFDVDAPAGGTVIADAGATGVAPRPQAASAPGPGPLPAAPAAQAAPPVSAAAPPQYAPQYATGYGQAPARTGSRVGGILMLIAGAFGLLYTLVAVFAHLQEIDTQEEAAGVLISAGFRIEGDPAGAYKMLLYATFGLAVAHVVQLVGGGMLAALRPAGKIWGVLGSLGVIAAWGSTLLIVVQNDLSLQALDWLALGVLVLFSIAGMFAALLSGPRR